jgi:hypothetical protein
MQMCAWHCLMTAKRRLPFVCSNLNVLHSVFTRCQSTIDSCEFACGDVSSSIEHKLVPILYFKHRAKYDQDVAVGEGNGK